MNHPQHPPADLAGGTVCDFSPDGHPAGPNQKIVSHDEVAQYSRAYANMLWDSCADVHQTLINLAIGEKLFKIDAERVAKGASELHDLTQKGDWLACPTCYEKWQRYKADNKPQED